jgi:hypothetical protein
MGDIKSRTPEVCGNLLTSLYIFDVPHHHHLSVQSTPATNQHEQLYVRFHIARYPRAALMGQTTRGPYYTDLSQIGRFSIRTVFPAITINPNQATFTGGSSDRRRGPSIFSSAYKTNDIRGNYNADIN